MSFRPFRSVHFDEPFFVGCLRLGVGVGEAFESGGLGLPHGCVWESQCSALSYLGDSLEKVAAGLPAVAKKHSVHASVGGPQLHWLRLARWMTPGIRVSRVSLTVKRNS